MSKTLIVLFGLLMAACGSSGDSTPADEPEPNMGTGGAASAQQAQAATGGASQLATGGSAATGGLSGTGGANTDRCALPGFKGDIGCPCNTTADCSTLFDMYCWDNGITYKRCCTKAGLCNPY